MPGARPRSPRGERPGSAAAAPPSPRPSKDGSPRPASPRARERPDAAPASPRVKKSPSAPAVGSGPGPRRPSRPPLPPSARPPRAPSSGALDSEANPNSVRSDDTDDSGARENERTNDAHETGSSTPRRREKDKEKAPPPSRVRVAVRVRPEVRENEKAEGGTGHLLCQGGRLWLVEAGGRESDGGAGGLASPRERNGTRQFVFDWSLPPTTTQEEVFNACCLETGVLKGVAEGFNGCVMCYGQTGAGKTYTLGNDAPGQEGIVPRALRYLLGEDGGEGEASKPSSRTIRLSMVQIYMEHLHDLLVPENGVELREAAEGVVLSGAESRPIESCAQALALIEEANKNRVTTATSMNDSSSRSHSVLVLDVQSKMNAKVYTAKLHLVDLAGSERVKKSEVPSAASLPPVAMLPPPCTLATAPLHPCDTSSPLRRPVEQVTGQAFDEACFINNSLTCLGRCVQALAAGPKAGKPPFRETKLTRLLSGAFGGRANTALCVCVAPSQRDAFETLNSLQFGQQAPPPHPPSQDATVPLLITPFALGRPCRSRCRPRPTPPSTTQPSRSSSSGRRAASSSRALAGRWRGVGSRRWWRHRG